ncbi:hypothetical protein KAJ38_03475 [Candidatus Pacearchaeota archaeon]|nr:hypothetical protein [Candidatus Pacearchaeota archaeon]
MLLKNRGVTLLAGLMVLLIAVPLISAGSYGSGAYSAGDYNIGAVSPPSTGGGSSDGGSSWQCSTDEDCGEDRYCLQHACYNYSCYSDADCDIKTGETCWMHRCVKLFDVKIIDFQSPIQLGTEFEFTYFLKGMADISGDVEVHFWIEKDGEVVTSGHDTIYIGNFEEKTEKTSIYLPTTINSGVYTFFVQLSYGDYIANTHRTVEIAVGEGGVASIIGVAETAADGFESYAIPVLIGFALLMLFIIFWLERKKIKAGIIKEEKWIKRHKVSVSVSILFFLLSVLIYCLNSAGYISLSNIWQFFISIFLPLSHYFYYIVGSIIGLIVLATTIILCRKNHVVQRIKSLLKEKIRKEKSVKRKLEVIKPNVEKLTVMKPVTEKLSFVSEHKKLLRVLALVTVLVGVLFYLFYSGIFTIGFLQSLWKDISNGFGSLVGGGVSFAKTIYSYLSPQNMYFYPVIASVVGLVVLTILGIIVKRFGLFGKFRNWQEQKRVENNKVENVQARAEKVEIFKEVVREHKILLVILGILVLSCVVVGALFYLGIVSVEQISEGTGNITSSVKSGWRSMVQVTKNFIPKAGDFITGYYVHILSCIGGAMLLLVVYLRRENLPEFLKMLPYRFKDLSKKQKIIASVILAVVILAALFYALFYYKVLSAEQFSIFFSNLGARISEFGQNMVNGISSLWNKIQPLLSSVYTISLNWIIQNYVYLIFGVLAVILIRIAYLNREGFQQIFYRIKYFIVEYKSFLLMFLGLVISSSIVFYIFYSKIVTLEMLKEILNYFKNSLSGIIG